MAEQQVVCVTGAGGYVGSWLVERLLSKGYTVHGTVRDPADKKYDHLRSLEKAAENLKLFKADLLDYNSLSAAIQGCQGVFHVATPVPGKSIPDPQVELIEPAVNGTLNVLKACSEAKVKRVVLVSSVAAVLLNPNSGYGQVKDETCWSDKDYCRTTNNWYCYAKTAAEFEAFEYAKKSGLDVVSVLPSLIFGPILQQTLNNSSVYLFQLLTEGNETYEDKPVFRAIVDVRDVAEALILAYEKSEAEGRYICSSHVAKARELVEILKKFYPGFNYPKSFTGEDQDDILYSTDKLQGLGWRFRPLEETLVDSIESYKQKKLLT